MIGQRSELEPTKRILPVPAKRGRAFDGVDRNEDHHQESLVYTLSTPVENKLRCTTGSGLTTCTEGCGVNLNV